MSRLNYVLSSVETANLALAVMTNNTCWLYQWIETNVTSTRSFLENAVVGRLDASEKRGGAAGA